MNLSPEDRRISPPGHPERLARAVKESNIRLHDLTAEYFSSAVGMDISLGMLRICGKKHGKLVQSAADSLPFADGSFDAVTCYSVLHYLYDQERLFRDEKKKKLRFFSILLAVLSLRFPPQFLPYIMLFARKPSPPRLGSMIQES